MMRLVQRKRNAEFFKLVQEWPKRTKLATEHIAYDLASTAYRDILSRLPKDRKYAAYRKSLKLVRIVDGRQKRHSFAIWSKPNRKMRGLVPTKDPDRLLVHVRAKRTHSPTSPEILALISRNPWTVDTLPFTPSATEAILDYEQTGKRRVAKIAAERRTEEPVWRRELIGLGVSLAKKSEGEKQKTPADTAETVGFAIGTEFGRGQQRATPHWQPVLRGIARKGILGIIRKNSKGSRYLEQLFTQLRIRNISQAARRLQAISKTTASRFSGFSKRILRGL